MLDDIMLYGTHTPYQQTCGEAVSVQWWLPLLTALRGCAETQMEGALMMWCTTVASWSISTICHSVSHVIHCAMRPTGGSHVRPTGRSYDPP